MSRVASSGLEYRAGIESIRTTTPRDFFSGFSGFSGVPFIRFLAIFLRYTPGQISSVIALARKYRPRNFATVAVQSHVSTTLKGAIARNRVAHGYLLCGPRGVGKTTLARVLAMALNCENKQPDGEPCGTCVSCERIWSGGASLDVVEIDAASNRGVDDARELRERAMYAPSGEDRYKVYIVDEAHMLTREAWNALLKILEEPPPRVVFVFATTEPQRIAQAAAPVLSRLQRFDFRRIGTADIKLRLASVLAEEKIEADPDALGLIARAADGSMRDALSLADQVLALGDGRVSGERVRDALGLVAEDEYIGLLDLIEERRAGDVFTSVAHLVERGIDLGQFLIGFSDILRAQLAIVLGAEASDLSDKAQEVLRARAPRVSAADLLRMLHALSDLEVKFRKSTQQQLLLEALLVRMALLDRTIDLENILSAMGGAGGAGGGGGGGDSTSRAASVAPARPVARAESRPARLEAPAQEGGRGGERVARDSVPAPARPQGSERPQASARAQSSGRPQDSERPQASERPEPRATRETPAAGKEPAVERPVRVEAEAPHAVPLDLNTIVASWDDIQDAMRKERPLLATFLSRSLPVAVTSGGLLTLQIEDRAAYEGLSGKDGELAAALSKHVVGLARIALTPPSGGGSNPERMTVESIKAETLQSLKRQAPLIAEAIDTLDLELLDER